MVIFSEINFTQLVTFPTRESNTLDIFATNRPTLINKCISVPGISDHDAVYIESYITAKYKKPAKRKIYLWDKTDFNLLTQVLSEFVSGFIAENTTSSSVQQMWDDFKTNCIDCLELVPYKYSSTRFSQPWVTSNTKRICRKKKRAYNKARSSGSVVHWNNYKELKRTAQRQCRKAYYDYVSRLFDSRSNSKKFWSFIKGRRKDNTGVTSLSVGGTTVTDDTSKANALNNQFASVFTRENVSTVPVISGVSFPDMDDIQIDVNGVAQLLSSLDPQKATGPDKIPTRFLKLFSMELAPCLTLLYQASLNQGIVPADWKKAFVVPVYKKGDRTLPENYRPISLTCVISKTLEHIISTNIHSHLNRHDILNDRQHGFRSRRSCETQLIDTINDFAETLNQAGQVDAIFLDMSKAFDTVPLKRLSCKLSYYGICGRTLKWIENLLTGRSQQVVVNGKYSDPTTVISGVPQGSVLGPLLFLCYINDITQNLTSKVRPYADDTLIYRNILNEQDVVALQNDLNTIMKWSVDW